MLACAYTHAKILVNYFNSLLQVLTVSFSAAIGKLKCKTKRELVEIQRNKSQKNTYKFLYERNYFSSQCEYSEAQIVVVRM